MVTHIRWRGFATLALLISSVLYLVPPHTGGHAAAASAFAIASIDTMKESRDTETRPLSDAQIADDVNLAASLNTTYLTVDTHWDYPDYMAHWVAAVRAAGRHVWFRIHPNQWGNNNGTTGIMAPAQYLASEQAFLLANSTLFQPGDILDPCPEPENGLYWGATYGHGWTSGAPNTATEAYNQFIRDTTDVADAALHQNGIYGVITTVRSTNSFFATHPGALEAATVAKMGRVTVDSYPESTITDPALATAARIDELNQIEAIWNVPVVIGEMGYSNKLAVDDTTQAAVLQAELAGLRQLPYLAGVNYWVGAGTANSGGYTHLFVGSTGNWTPRPAAYDLATFYASMLGGPAPTATPANTATSTEIPSPAPPSSTISPTRTSTILPSATVTAAWSPSATGTATRQPSATGTPAATITSTPAPPTRTSTALPATSTSTAVAHMATASPTRTVTPAPSVAATIVPPSPTAANPTRTGTASPSGTRTVTPASSATSSPTITATPGWANATSSPTITATPGWANATSSPTPFVDPVLNGGFENGSLAGWTYAGVGTGGSPSVVTSIVLSGHYAARLGVANSYSEPKGDNCLYQNVRLLGTHRLSFAYNPYDAYGDTIGYDWQEGYYRPFGTVGCSESGTRIFKVESNVQSWIPVSLTITGPGQIYFNVHEDGSGDPSAMYADDVSIS